MLFTFSFINSNDFNIMRNYHYALLLFNLLPIYPLDGSKLINLLSSKFISYKSSHKLMLYISVIALLISIFICIIYIPLNINLYLICFLLIYKIIEEIKKHPLIINKFILERFLYKFNFKKRKIINGNNIYKMQRDYTHIFKINKKFITEKAILNKLFSKYH